MIQIQGTFVVIAPRAIVSKAFSLNLRFIQWKFELFYFIKGG